MLLADVVDASTAVAGTRARSVKTAHLADVLRQADDVELPVVAGWLAGLARPERAGRGRAGVGWVALSSLREVPAAPEPTLTVAQVDDALAGVAGVAGAGSGGRRTRQLHDLLGRATAPEQRFLAALLGGELRQGALQALVVDALAAAADVPVAAVRRAVMLLGSLHAAAPLTRHGTEALAAVRLQPMRPVAPMLASPGDDPDAAVAGLARALVEEKLDGVRVQVHRHGEEVLVVTRSLRDVTVGLPHVVAAARAARASTLVLDGEALVVRADGRPAPFQVSASAAGEEAAGARGAADLARPGDTGVVRFFDLLHVDGEDLLDRPLHERRARLEEVVDAGALVPAREVGSGAEVRAALEAAVAAGHEGVVVKDADAPYAAGRRGAAWRKVKPVHTLDLLVLAVEDGSGRRRGTLSNLHLGARDPAGGPPVRVGKTFKGLSDALLAWQTRELGERATRREGHVLHVRPDLVVEIALDGVQRSRRYPGGLALRFARVVRYRDDLGPDDADDMDAVRALWSG